MEETGYKFFDESRFKLTCGYYSEHLQCIISQKGLAGYGYSQCPISDTLKCNWYGDIKKNGANSMWGPQDY